MSHTHSHDSDTRQNADGDDADLSFRWRMIPTEVTEEIENFCSALNVFDIDK